MNFEESRLRTFGGWPATAPIEAERIANAGFYYTGQDLDVQCFSCGGKISDWTEGDHVMTKHRRLDPRCPFIVNPVTSGNVPKSSSPASGQVAVNVPVDFLARRDTDSRLLASESSRLQTFTNWPITHIVTPDSLANAGFYSLQEGDKVKCAFCKGVVGFWVLGDDPHNEHRRHFPTCTFVKANFKHQVDKKLSLPELQELGIHTHKGPRQPDYATLESRMRTFTNWPMELIQTPEMLSEAGFYYVGAGDQVRCFHCDGGLRHWDPQDQPWVEHAKWFPTCAFLRIVKGSDFIKTCSSESTSSTSDNEVRTKRTSPITINRKVTESEIQALMNTPEVLTALNIGIDVGRIKNALRYKLEMTGVHFSCADTLIECALNLETEDIESATDTETSEDVTKILQGVLMQADESLQGAAPSESCVDKEKKDKCVVDSPDKALSLEEENRLLREARMCKICMDNEIGIVFLPCGHLTTCVNCAPSLNDCPVCRSEIKATIRIYLS